MAILVGSQDHRTQFWKGAIQAKNRKRGGWNFNCPSNTLCVWPAWIQHSADGHNFERDPPRDHPCQFWFNLVPGFRGEDLNVIFNQNMPNLHNRYKSSPLKPLNQIKPNLAGIVPGWVPFKIVSDSAALHSRWLLLLKIEISSIVHCCFSISQNKLKF